MLRSSLRQAATFLAVLVLLSLSPQGASAQWITTDVSNLVAMSRNFYQFSEQINETRRRVQQAQRNLQAVETLTGWNGLQAIQGVDQVYNAGGGLPLDVANMESFVENRLPVNLVYDDYYSERDDTQLLLGNAYKSELEAQHQYYRNMEDTQNNLNNISSRAESAEGNLETQQLLLDLGLAQATQQQMLRSQLLGMARMEALSRRAQISEEQQRREAFVEKLADLMISEYERLVEYDPPNLAPRRNIGGMSSNPFQ